MNKIEIEVPKEVRFISEWPDFPKEQLSTGHCIVNKTITGCGYTHYSLTNDQPVILCSPRKFLLENKHRQLHEDYHTYLVINDGEKSLDVDGDNSSEIISLGKKKINSYDIETSNDFKIISGIEDSLREYIFNCQFNGIAPKVLVTYDSLKYVLGVLKESISLYSIIVDEFQNIFMDSRFKAETELNFLSYLQSCPNVTYLSATPYIEEYLNELDEFKDLPYYELKWYPDRLQTIKIDPKKVFRPNQEIDRIIQDYLVGKFPEKIDEDTKEVYQSKEVVFYANSVRMISSTITRNNLNPDQVNIICADTERNKKTLKRIGHTIGVAPLKGEPHKMFTFCTRTTYAGADFYSTSAMSVIVSDCAIDSLATDIRMDFPQIMGRQRLKENKFKDECIFIYKLSDETVTMDEYKSLSLKKLEKSQRDLKNFEVLVQSGEAFPQDVIKDIRLRVKIQRYGEDYTGIREDTGTPMINKLVMISERRAFELRSNVYKSDVQVYNEFANISSEMSYEDSVRRNQELLSLRTIYKANGSFESKMRILCNFLLNPDWNGHVHISDLYWLPLKVRNYLSSLGPKRIKELECRECEIIRELSGSPKIKEKKISSSVQKKPKQEEFALNPDLPVLVDCFSKQFIVGQRYSLKESKEIISKIYKLNNITKTPKATDLEDYFNIRKCTINLKDGKRINGYEILGLK